MIPMTTPTAKRHCSGCCERAPWRREPNSNLKALRKARNLPRKRLQADKSEPEKPQPLPCQKVQAVIEK